MCELRRAHPRWGAQRIVHELMRGPAPPEPLPSRATVHRILVRHGLVIARARRRKRVGLCALAAAGGDAAVAAGHRVSARGWSTRSTGELREGRIVTGVDDHSRFCVLARVVERATGRAICLAFAEALERYGAPEEVLTDNGKQFTDRFGRGGEVLFDKICRRNGIAHRLTAPSSPTTTGKIERFHQTLRRELLDDARPFTSLLEAQAALDDWVREYNADRPHQALETARAGHAGRALPARRRTSSASCWGCGCPAASPPSRRRRRTPTAERAVDAGAAAEVDRGRAGRVRPRGPAVGEPVGDAPPVLARPPAGRADGALLGRRRRDPPLDRRRPRQEPALAPEHRRSRPARAATARSRPVRRRCRRPRTGRRSRSTAPSTTAAWSASPAARCSPPRSSAAGP